MAIGRLEWSWRAQDEQEKAKAQVRSQHAGYPMGIVWDLRKVPAHIVADQPSAAYLPIHRIS